MPRPDVLYFKTSGSAVEARSLEDEVPAQSLESLEAEAWRLARSWYRHPAAAPFCRYKNDDIGELSELYFGNFFCWALKNTAAIRELLLKYPDASFEACKAGGAARDFFPEPDEPVVSLAARSAGVRSILETDSGPAERPSAHWPSLAKTALRQWVSAGEGALAPVKNSKQPVLLIASAPQHVQPLLPELRRRFSLIFFDEDFRLAKMKEALAAGARYVSYPRLARRLPEAAAASIAAFAARCAAFAAERHPVYPWPSQAFGLNLDAVAAPRFEYYLKTWAPRAASLIETFDSFFSENRVDAVLVDEDTVTFRKALVRAAGRAGAATFQVPHGVAFSGKQYDLFPVSSDYALVGGSAVRDFYVEEGTPSEKIVVCGVPRMAAVPPPAARGEGVKRIFLAATTFFPMEVRRRRSEYRRALSDLTRVLKAASGPWRLRVKLHPLDRDPGETIRVFEAAGIACEKASGSTAEILAQSDLVFSFYSNLAIESLLAHRPTAILDYFAAEGLRIPYLDGEGAWMRVRDERSLKLLSDELWSDSPEVRERVSRAAGWFRANWVGPADGRTAWRMAEAIEARLR